MTFNSQCLGFAFGATVSEEKGRGAAIKEWGSWNVPNGSKENGTQDSHPEGNRYRNHQGNLIEATSKIKAHQVPIMTREEDQEIRDEQNTRGNMRGDTSCSL